MRDDSAMTEKRHDKSDALSTGTQFVAGNDAEVIDVSMTRRERGDDAHVSYDGQGNDKRIVDINCQQYHPGNKSVLDAARRRSQVEYLLLSGLSSSSIARELGCAWITVQRDCEYLKEYRSHTYQADALRSTMTRRLLGIAEIAESRYREGGEGATVEGRLLIDAYARVAKMHGLDDSALSTEVAPALARLFDAMADNVTGTSTTDDDTITVCSP
jgi:hypothetical protein